MDDKDLTTNICEKSEQIFKMDDASVHHLPIYVGFLGDSVVLYPPIKVLSKSKSCRNKSNVFIELATESPKNHA